MQVCQVDLLQEDVLSQMGFDNDTQEVDTKTPELVYCLLGIHPTVAETVLGKVGKKLIEFINKVDVDHPDLPYVINEIFNKDSVFIQQVTEAVELAYNCKHLSALSHNFHKLVDRNRFSKFFVQNTVGTRLFKSREERETIRKQKHMQIVGLKVLYKKTDIWNRQPLNFKVFNRHNVPYLEAIGLSEDKVSRYAELGCQTIVSKITNEIEQFKSMLNQRYFGFNRITMTIASLILARMHDYKLKTAWDIHDNKIVNIIIPTNLLYDFEPSELPIISFIQDFSISGEYHYEPRAYPINEMIHTASEDMLRLIEHLDNFPDIGGKTLFDDFIVLVPSVKLSQSHFIQDKMGNTLGFDGKEEALKFLDTTLIENHNVYPILLGVRDGKCYFVSYWK